MTKPSKPEYEKLERTLVSIYETSFTDRKKPLRFSFSKDWMDDLGGVSGATPLVLLKH